MTINGIPVHPLVVHAAVVFTPLAALGAVAYLVPKWREHLRWPVLATSVLAALFVWLAASTGDSLASSVLSGNSNAAVIKAIQHHEDLAGKLQAATWFLAAISAGVWWFHKRPGRAFEGKCAETVPVETGDHRNVAMMRPQATVPVHGQPFDVRRGEPVARGPEPPFSRSFSA